MTKNSNDKSSKSIYEILGIEKKIGRDSSDKNASIIPDEQETEPLRDEIKGASGNLPSGSLFDNYSRYTDGDPAYWRWFRALSYTGIGVTVAMIVLIFWCPLPDLKATGPEYIPEVPESLTFEDNFAMPEDEPIGETKDEPSAYDIMDGIKYFKGKIDGKYAVHMKLDFDDRDGKYYYDKSGSQNCMTIRIVELQPQEGVNYYMKLEEYNSDDEYCGYWEGIIEYGDFNGIGNYMGKEMPFSLSECSFSETDF